MFSAGQAIFAAFFCIVFIAVTVVAYQKDKKRHQRYYKGVAWIGLAFLVFVVLLFSLKHFLKE